MVSVSGALHEGIIGKLQLLRTDAYVWTHFSVCGNSCYAQTGVQLPVVLTVSTRNDSESIKAQRNRLESRPEIVFILIL